LGGKAVNSSVNERTPPHNLEAEQAVIGAIFLEPQAFSTASERLVSTDFYRANHQSIFATMSALSEKGEPIDVVTVTTDLANKDLDKAVNSSVNERTPPHNLEAEQAVIGAIFLEPQAFSTASERLVSTDFYRANHQSIFATMSALSEKGEPIDVVTVTTDLANKE